ncbi:endo-1,4-beta-xylanase [Luteolibacter arcticus]|uniref:endo-1,4-beta-xylanase n=1 Tax=Luteolibacter arcticus TaxID=1581411 RepID=A0ABT3GCW3_9BACT|nr:endo-1,4-beta-xylanase [Luteolibacter arcticus]MCW1921394.1 endo-1,4-beta-xylanase [Luteolibacter arcticus]
MKLPALPLRLLLGLLAVASLLADVVVPPGGSDLAGESALKVHADPGHATVSQLEGGGWKIDVNRPDEARAFLAQVSLDCPAAALEPGETVLALIKGRAPAGSASIEAKLQLGGPPYTMAAPTTALELGTDLKEVPVVFRVTAAIEKGRGSLTLLCAGKLQTVEIASIRVFHYPAGTDTSGFPRIRRTYAGREADAPWRKAALDRIEKHRKADFSVRVRGADGEPLSNAKVTLTLRRHEFGFGAAVTAELMTAETEDARKYRELVDRLFSRVVFENDLKDFGWETGAAGKEEHKQRLDQAFGWLGRRKISVRGHYLMQVAVPPNLAEVTDSEAIRRHFLDTAQERIDFARDRVCEWDVINHPVAWSGADLLSKRPGLEKLDREIYGLAQRATSLPFFVNEDQIFRPGRQADETFAYLEALKRDGFRVDGLGNQAHFDESFLPSPEQLLAVTDRFAALAPRQAITEFDIVTQDDEELAADYTRDALIACFSHPAYTGFLLWGFWEGSHWKPEAASWNRDWSIRKRGEVLEEWLGRRWTTQVTLTTGKGGLLRWRGFPGHYQLEMGDKQQEFSVSKAIPAATVQMP